PERPGRRDRSRRAARSARRQHRTPAGFRAVESGHGAGRRKLPVRRRSVRADAAVPPRRPLPLLALPQALGRVRAHAGPCAARRLSPAGWRRADSRLPASGRDGEGVLLALRLEPVRRDVAGRARGLDPLRRARRRSGDPAPVPLAHRVGRHVGRDPGRRPAPTSGAGAHRITTPLEPAPQSLAGRDDVWLKREDVHELGAFKWRAALPVVERHRDEGARAVVTASTGNHGAATAWAARRAGIEAVVFAPENASRVKLAHLQGLGAGVRLVGADLDEAKGLGQAFARDEGLPFFEDGAEPLQYEAYGAIGDEILDQLSEPPAAVVVPVGNGALLGGVGGALARRAPSTLRIGVAAKEAPVMALSWQAHRVVDSDRNATMADGLAVRVAIPYAVDVLEEVADRMLLVSEREMARAVGAFDRAGIRTEAAAGAALAALPQLDDVDGPIVLVVTGRNIDDDLLARCHERPESFPD